MKVKSLSHARLFATPWTVAYQAPPSMGFSRQEYWSGVPLPSPGDLPDPGIERGSLALQADSLLSEPPRQPINGSKGRAKNRGTGSKPFKKRAEGSRAFSSFILPAHLSRRLYVHSLERMKQGT